MKVLLASDGFVTSATLYTALARVPPDVETASISSTWPVPLSGDIGDVRETAGDEDELIEALDDCDVAFSHTLPFTEKVVVVSPSLKLVTVCRGGPISVNIGAVTRAGVLVSYTPGRSATATTKHTVGMIPANLRRIPQRHREVIDGQWYSDYCIFDNVGTEIGSSAIGVVGYSAIGQRVTAVMVAFGACVLAYNPWTDRSTEGMARVDPLGELLVGSDVVTIHARVTAEDRGMIDADTLALMSEGSVLVNCAHDELVDYDVVCDAFNSGHFSAAGFDVLPQKPPSPGHRLLRTPRVTITPHLAGAPKETARIVVQVGAEDIAIFAVGRRSLHPADPEAPEARARLFQAGGVSSGTSTAPSETDGKTPKVGATGPETGEASSGTGAAAPEADPKAPEDNDQVFGKQAIMLLERERRNVVETRLLMQSNGLIVGTAGDVSVRVDDRIVILPSGVPYETMTIEDIVIFSMDGGHVDGVLEPSSELPLHPSVYRKTAVRAIMHSHAPASTALGLVVDETPPFHYYSVMFGGIIRAALHVEFGTDEFTRNVTDALEGRSGALMGNHGAITIEPTVEKTVGLLPILEYVCEVHLRVMAMDAPIALPSPEQMTDAKVAITDYDKQPNRE